MRNAPSRQEGTLSGKRDHQIDGIVEPTTLEAVGNVDAHSPGGDVAYGENIQEASPHDLHRDGLIGTRLSALGRTAKHSSTSERRTPHLYSEASLSNLSLTEPVIYTSKYASGTLPRVVETSITKSRRELRMRSIRIATSVALLLSASALGSARADSHGSSAALSKALADTSRSEVDRNRDAGRKPADVIRFLGIEEGMHVIDLIAASGYYTEVLSLAVGPTGTVYAQNPPSVLQYRDGAADKAMSVRLADSRLANVMRLDREMSDTGLKPDSLDAAITALNFHDIYNDDPAAAASFLKAVRMHLKPGGVLGVIDHFGSAGADNAKLHRIEEQLVIDAVEAAGFVVEATSDVLRNPSDDRTTGVFDPSVRGKTDRFVLKLRSP